MATPKTDSLECGSGAGAGAGAVVDARHAMKVLEETAGFSLPINFNGNLVAATTDEQLTEILSTAKTSRRMVRFLSHRCPPIRL